MAGARQELAAALGQAPESQGCVAGLDPEPSRQLTICRAINSALDRHSCGGPTASVAHYYSAVYKTRAAVCNQLLAEGWVLLGVYPLTTLGEMAEGRSRREQEQRQPQDTQRYVRRLVGYVVGRSRE